MRFSYMRLNKVIDNDSWIPFASDKEEYFMDIQDSKSHTYDASD